MIIIIVIIIIIIIIITITIIIIILNPTKHSKKLQVLAVTNGNLPSFSQEILQIPTIDFRCIEIRQKEAKCINKFYQNGIVIKSSAYLELKISKQDEAFLLTLLENLE